MATRKPKLWAIVIVLLPSKSEYWSYAHNENTRSLHCECVCVCVCIQPRPKSYGGYVYNLICTVVDTIVSLLRSMATPPHCCCPIVLVNSSWLAVTSGSTPIQIGINGASTAHEGRCSQLFPISQAYII